MLRSPSPTPTSVTDNATASAPRDASALPGPLGNVTPDRLWRNQLPAGEPFRCNTTRRTPLMTSRSPPRHRAADRRARQSDARHPHPAAYGPDKTAIDARNPQTLLRHRPTPDRALVVFARTVRSCGEVSLPGQLQAAQIGRLVERLGRRQVGSRRRRLPPPGSQHTLVAGVVLHGHA